MNISTGISEINYLSSRGNSPRAERIYTWPVYNSGRIGRIRGIKRRTESNIVYSKPSPEDRLTLLKLSSGETEIEYTRTGRVNSKNALSHSQGSFFDAIA